ncbi:28201_t:CDS:2, partial [Racocetra persica]
EWLSLGSSLMDSLMGWLEVPPIDANNSLPKQHNVSAHTSNNKNQTILDIPLQFIDLLTYPEIDSKASKKASFAAP